MIAGKALSNTQKWLEATSSLTAAGVELASFIIPAIRVGTINAFHSSWTNMNPRSCFFRGRSYDSLADLLSADIKNGSSIDEYPEEVKAEIGRLLALGAVVEVSRSDALGPGSVINPIQLNLKEIPNAKPKRRLILHAKMNVTYSRPTLKMPEISGELDTIANLPGIAKVDQSDAYYQYGLDRWSSRFLRFGLIWDGRMRYFEMSTLVMGGSCSSYVVQKLNEVITQAFTIKYKKYANCYSDDFWSDSSAPEHLDTFAAEFGLFFKKDKKFVGKVVPILGIQVDLNRREARLEPAKAEGLAVLAASIRSKRVLSPASLASLAGKIEYATKVCVSGRAKTFYITKLLASDAWKEWPSREAWLASEEESIGVDDALDTELGFWAGIGSHPPLKIGQSFVKYVSPCSSDASSTRFGLTIGDKVVGGSFPAGVRDASIAIKEAYALKFLIDSFTEKGCDYFVQVDNQAVISAFTKGRSTSKQLHDLVFSAKSSLARLESTITLKWIPTSVMANLADAPSRNRYPRDPFGLTPKGVERLFCLQPNIRDRRARGDLISCFGGPNNNPLGIEYFSIHLDYDDVLCRGREVFGFLEDRASKGRGLAGGVFAYPPACLVVQFCRLVRRMRLEDDTVLHLLAPGYEFQAVFNLLAGVGELSWEKFCGAGSKTFFWKKPGHSMMLFRLENNFFR